MVDDLTMADIDALAQAVVAKAPGTMKTVVGPIVRNPFDDHSLGAVGLLAGLDDQTAFTWVDLAPSADVEKLAANAFVLCKLRRDRLITGLRSRLATVLNCRSEAHFDHQMSAVFGFDEDAVRAAIKRSDMAHTSIAPEVLIH